MIDLYSSEGIEYFNKTNIDELRDGFKNNKFFNIQNLQIICEVNNLEKIQLLLDHGLNLSELADPNKYQFDVMVDFLLYAPYKNRYSDLKKMDFLEKNGFKLTAYNYNKKKDPLTSHLLDGSVMGKERLLFIKERHPDFCIGQNVMHGVKNSITKKNINHLKDLYEVFHETINEYKKINNENLFIDALLEIDIDILKFLYNSGENITYTKNDFDIYNLTLYKLSVDIEKRQDRIDSLIKKEITLTKKKQNISKEELIKQDKEILVVQKSIKLNSDYISQYKEKTKQLQNFAKNMDEVIDIIIREVKNDYIFTSEKELPASSTPKKRM